MQQRNALARRVPLGVSLEDQWYAVFEIVCPGCPRPISPYHDSEVSGAVLAELRLFLTSEMAADSILGNLRRSNYLNPMIDASLRDALSQELGDLFDRWAAQHSAGIEYTVRDDTLYRPSSSDPLIVSSNELQPLNRFDTTSTTGTAIPAGEPSSIGQHTNHTTRSSQDLMSLYASGAPVSEWGRGSDTISLPELGLTVQFTPAAEIISQTIDQGREMLPQRNEDVELPDEFAGVDLVDPNFGGFSWDTCLGR